MPTTRTGTAPTGSGFTSWVNPHGGSSFYGVREDGSKSLIPREQAIDWGFQPAPRNTGNFGTWGPAVNPTNPIRYEDHLYGDGTSGSGSAYYKPSTPDIPWAQPTPAPGAGSGTGGGMGAQTPGNQSPPPSGTGGGATTTPGFGSGTNPAPQPGGSGGTKPPATGSTGGTATQMPANPTNPTGLPPYMQPPGAPSPMEDPSGWASWMQMSNAINENLNPSGTNVTPYREGTSAWETSPQYSLDDYNSYVDQAFEGSMRTLQPQFDRAQKDFEQDMINRGLAPGSEAYNERLDQFTRSKNDLLSKASTDALAYGASRYDTDRGFDETQRQFNLGADEGQRQFDYAALEGTRTNNRDYWENMRRANRGMDLNELTTMDSINRAWNDIGYRDAAFNAGRDDQMFNQIATLFGFNAAPTSGAPANMASLADTAATQDYNRWQGNNQMWQSVGNSVADIFRNWPTQENP